MSEPASPSGARLRLGVRLPGSGTAATPENLMTVASLAETLGYQSIWCTDHLLSVPDVRPRYPGTPDGHWPFPVDTRWLEPVTTLTWLSAVVPSVELGTGVLVLPLRNPIVLAKQTSTLDFLTGGRVVLGVGVGWMAEEFAAVGVGYANRARRAGEAVELLRRLWTGAEVDFAGEFWQLRAASMHPQPVRRSIPVVWGGMARATVRRVARTGDGWLPTFGTLGALRAGLAVLREECELAARPLADIRILFKPGPQFDVDAELAENLLALGVTDYIFDPHPARLDRRRCEEDMVRLAEACRTARCGRSRLPTNRHAALSRDSEPSSKTGGQN